MGCSFEKKGITITNAFQNILDESNRKPKKIRVNKDSEFHGCRIMMWKRIQHIMKETLLLLKDLFGPKIIKFTNI